MEHFSCNSCDTILMQLVLFWLRLVLMLQGIAEAECIIAKSSACCRVKQRALAFVPLAAKCAYALALLYGISAGYAYCKLFV